MELIFNPFQEEELEKYIEMMVQQIVKIKIDHSMHFVNFGESTVEDFYYVKKDLEDVFVDTLSQENFKKTIRKNKYISHDDHLNLIKASKLTSLKKDYPQIYKEIEDRMYDEGVSLHKFSQTYYDEKSLSNQALKKFDKMSQTLQKKVINHRSDLGSEYYRDLNDIYYKTINNLKKTKIKVFPELSVDELFEKIITTTNVYHKANKDGLIKNV